MHEVRILLVEDDPSDVQLTMHALHRNNLANDIQVVRDGEEALDFLFCRGNFAGRAWDHPPRMVLLDLKLPKVNGLEVLREIKSDPRTKTIPVIVMTGSREDQDLARCYELGVNSYIQKPMDFNQFVEIVKQLGYYWLVVNQSPPAPAHPSS
ncbi:MAG: response regulator [Armatimonadetes bacterium]|nr:response regulator [Armatimonadota bacterium]MBI2973910.1 response regulator [Armatimonadota bacterium]